MIRKRIVSNIISKVATCFIYVLLLKEFFSVLREELKRGVKNE
jgi:hypothetical protein